jgi:hypothetical protein
VDEYAEKSLSHVSNLFDLMKEHWDLSKDFEKSLVLIIRSMKELSKDYESNGLMFDYLYGAFISISLGPELVHKQMHYIPNTVKNHPKAT